MVCQEADDVPKGRQGRNIEELDLIPPEGDPAGRPEAQEPAHGRDCNEDRGIAPRKLHPGAREANKLNRTICPIAARPSRQPIFFPSS